MDFSLATRKRRFVSNLLDSIFLAILVILIEFICLIISNGEKYSDFMTTIISFPLSCLYFSADGGVRQGTWGKRILGIRVERLDHTRLERFKAFLRHLAHILFSGIIPLLIALLIAFMSWIILLPNPFSFDIDPSLMLEAPFYISVFLIPTITCVGLYLIYYTFLYNKQTGQFLHDRVCSSRVIRVIKNKPLQTE